MGFLNNLRMRTRLLGAFAITTLITLLVGLLGMNSTSQQAAAMSSMYENRLLPIQDVAGANKQALYVSRNLSTYVILTDPADISKLKGRIEERMQNYRVLMTKYQATELAPQETALLSKLMEAWRPYLAAQAKVFKLADEGRDAEAYAVITEEAMPAFQVADDLLSELVQVNAELAKASNLASDQNYAQVRNIIIAAIAIAVVLSAALAMVITASVIGPLAQGVQVAESVAAGDLTVEVKSQGSDEVAQLLNAMGKMKDGLVSVVSRVRTGSESVSSASIQIAEGNQDLSSRTEQQASALEETAASMEELSSTVKQNADNAQQANQLAQTASTVAIQGGQVVSQVVDTMKGIETSSKKIADIISVIDGIAFQTNILALNAAVEAARAGEQGRGFAVVAGEVRNLAQRSASAAKEIKELITESVERVSSGTVLVDKAGSTMHEVVDSVRRVTDIMAEISAASKEQSDGVAQIGEAVTQMDQATQQNAALVEEMAAAASSLRTQATDLVETVAVFRLDNREVGFSAVSPVVRSEPGKVSCTQASSRPALKKPAARAAALPASSKPAPHTQPATANAAGDWESF
ncbi:MAG: methyl-accepting chemotaxis protein [Pseudomonadota bacterium]